MSRKNRLKKSILKKHRKNQTKQSRNHKEKYISKADREKLTFEEETQELTTDE